MQDLSSKQKQDLLEQIEKNPFFLSAKMHQIDQQMITYTNRMILIFADYEEENKNVLKTYWAVAAKIIEPSIKIDKVQKKVKKMIYVYFEVEQQNLKEKEIKTFQLFSQRLNSLESITMFEGRNSQGPRVVVIPICKALTAAKQVSNNQLAIKKIEDQYDPKLKIARGEAYNQLERQMKAEIEAVNSTVRISEKPLATEMFSIISIVKALIQKCKKFQFLLLLEGDQDQARLKQNIKTFIKKIDNQYTHKGVKPMLFIYDQTQVIADPSKQIAGYFLVNDEEIEFKNSLINDEQSFTEQKYFKPNLYEIKEGNNPELTKYCTSCADRANQMTNNLVQCIGGVLKTIYEQLDITVDIFSELTNSKASISSAKSESNKVLYNYFNKIEEFIDSKIFYSITSEHILQEHFAKERFPDIEFEPNQPLVPQEIMGIVFLDELRRLEQTFNEKVIKIEQEIISTGVSKNDKFLISQIINHLKSICELLLSINEDYLKKQKTGAECKKLQKYYNFLKFSFDSLERINFITGRDISCISVLKNYFKVIQPKKSKIIDYLLNLQKGGKINKNASVHYYDLLLRIIKDCQEDQKKVTYLKVYIKFLKSWIISKRYITDGAKVVIAINGFLEIIKNKQVIPPTEKQTVQIFQIERRIAELLRTVGKPELAMRLYQKNQLFSDMKDTFQQIIMPLPKQNKSQKYLEFGHILLRINRFQTALSFFQKAHKFAQNKQDRLKAKAGQDMAQNRQNPSKQDYKVKLDAYLKKGNEQAFLNMELSEKTINELNNLHWDESKERCI